MTGQSSKVNVPYFLKSEQSQFADGYDIKGEAGVLVHLIESDDPDATDPLFPRLMEYYERQKQLDQRAVEHLVRAGAESVITDREAIGVKQLGGYESSEQNTVTLHTKEAYRLFTGRAPQPVATANSARFVPPIMGARRAGSMLRSLWLLSATDNPYADWALIDVHNRIVEQTEKLRQQTVAMELVVAKLKQRGIIVSVIQARDAQQVPLGFASPYAFLLVEMLAEFDYFVRVVKTMESISKLGGEESRKIIGVEVTAQRAMFELIQRYERTLNREKLTALTRADWLPAATDEAIKRVQAIIALFGVIPREVFNGEVTPRHTRRDMRVSAETLQVLSQLELNPKRAPKQISPADVVSVLVNGVTVGVGVTGGSPVLAPPRLAPAALTREQLVDAVTRQTNGQADASKAASGAPAAQPQSTESVASAPARTKRVAGGGGSAQTATAGVLSRVADV